MLQPPPVKRSIPAQRSGPNSDWATFVGLTRLSGSWSVLAKTRRRPAWTSA